MTDPKTVNVKNNRPSLVELPHGTRLRPGENPVSAKRWESEKANPNTARFLKLGILEVLDRPARPHDTNATAEERAKAKGRRADELQDFDLDQIKTIVADTDDLDLLEAWEKDDRGDVQKVVGARIRALKKKKK